METQTKARHFIERYFPEAEIDVLGGESNNGFRADVYLVHEHGITSPYTVFSALVGDIYEPLLVTELPHIPYSEAQRGWAQTDDSLGVFVQIENVYEPSAQQARLMLASGSEVVTTVTQGHAVLYHWNSPWLTFREQAKLTALQLEEGRWATTVSPLLACRPQTFANAYIAAIKGDVQFRWASDAIEALGAVEYFPLARALATELEPSQPAYKNFIETSLSSMMSPQLRSLIDHDKENHAVWERALQRLKALNATEASGL